MSFCPLPSALCLTLDYINIFLNRAVLAPLYHDSFGEGEVTHLLGLGKKSTIVIQFATGKKIIDPNHTKMVKISAPQSFKA